jgi:hypothetical protein
MMLLPVQIAPFLSTLVKKGILSDFHWHLFYTLSLSIPYLYPWIVNQYSPVKFNVMILITITRFYMRFDKYLIWSVVILLFMRTISPLTAD